MGGNEFDFLVVGAGIAGASTAWRLADHGQTALCESEAHAGFHTTGRTVALFDRSYGNAPIRELTVASEAFLASPPLPVTGPVLAQRGVLHVAESSSSDGLAAWYREIRETAPMAALLDGRYARDRVPILRPEASATCVWDPSACDIDVAALMAGLVSDFRRRGGAMKLRQQVTRLAWTGERWSVETTGGDLTARVVVNAAGAWADALAVLAGLQPLGIVPKRRSVAVIPASDSTGMEHWPFTVDAEMKWYFKGERGRLLVSPAEEVPVMPGDAAVDDVDLAAGIERFEMATTLRVDRVSAQWAGLRSFFADGTPVVGSDPQRPEFVWCAGLGGYGIQVAPAVSTLAAATALGATAPFPSLAAAVAPGRRLVPR